ncbi:MAG: response regulator transcription factor [Oscillospiraceae bacterium]|nr:response regulator transcription factor [Oscillospiraceae bacterium]
MRILVVEDERDLNRILNKTLSAEGCSVDACFDGLEALDYLSGASYDVIVLDRMMPRMDGMELLSRLRAQGDETPVIFLTAKDAVAERVRGLDAGADDYLVKPFSFEELMARIRVVTRKHSGSTTNLFTVGDLTVDTGAHTVRRGEKNINLSTKEFALLEYMIRNKGVVLSRESIENNLWNYDYSGGSNVVDVYISYLRRKIDSGWPKKLIHTVWGVGWVLREEE